MAQQSHLRNAPIREALIDIKVRGVAAASLAGGLPERLAREYPRVERINFHQFEVQVNESKEVVSASVARDTGFRAFSHDGLLIAQFREDGFTLSRLAPYQTWENLRDETQRLWAAYLEIAKPERVMRIALRYVNQINLPLPFGDFSEYLHMAPNLPPGVPQALSSFLMRYVIPAPEAQAVAIVTQALEGSTDAIVPVILDIDVFEDMDCPTQGNECWATLSRLHNLKNTIFFKSITEKTKGMYL